MSRPGEGLKNKKPTAGFGDGFFESLSLYDFKPASPANFPAIGQTARFSAAVRFGSGLITLATHEII
jgi:hypothetical protein